MKLSRALATVATTAALACGTVVAASPQAAAAESKVVCKANVLTVRSKPTAKSRAVSYLRQGQRVSGTKVRGTNFYQIGRGRYVGGAYLCSAGAVQLNSKRAMAQPTATLGSRTGSYGWRVHPVTKRRDFHRGIDIGNRAGMPVYAAASGVVRTASSSRINGRYIQLAHGTVAGHRNVGTYYMHLSRSLVRPGQKVVKGQLIGYTGNTGRSTKPHLHFSVRVNNSLVDPQLFVGPTWALR